jgi:7-carboxy-7-deazaguanine synthase
LEKTYTINEHFYAWQGEGVHMGRAAYFIRFQGCDQSCHFCDSAGTWHKDYKPEKSLKLDVIETAELLLMPEHRYQFVVLTGGEPCLYNLEPLIKRIHGYGLKVHIETAGHRPIPKNADWVTLSPKGFAKPPLKENVERADEYKIIVENPESFTRDMQCIEKSGPDKPIWLHPEWSKRNDPDVLAMINKVVKRYGDPFRAGYQLHKIYNVDKEDPNADQRLIPLGGIIKK